MPGPDAEAGGAGPFCMAADEWPGMAKLIEEMGELNQVLGKIMMLGGAVDHWQGDLTPELVDELGDVTAALVFFVENSIPGLAEAIQHRAEGKMLIFGEWRAQGRQS